MLDGLLKKTWKEWHAKPLGENEMVDFNINNYVWVKLTKRGWAILEGRHDALKSTLPSVGDFISPKEDSEGWSKWQLWVLMSTFDGFVGMGMQEPFETTIKIDVIQ